VKLASSHLVVKRVGTDARTFEGIATTVTPDHIGDVVNPAGARFSLPLPLLFSHAHDKPIGHVTRASVGKAAITFEAKIADIQEPGTLKDRCDEAWQSIKSSLINSVSIGFMPKKSSPLAGGGMLFDEWTWYELSICTVPMNPEAVITSRRSLELMLEGAERKSHRVVRLEDPKKRGCVVKLEPKYRTWEKNQ
jgi:HK97 family phage prohead protease